MGITRNNHRINKNFDVAAHRQQPIACPIRLCWILIVRPHDRERMFGRL